MLKDFGTAGLLVVVLLLVMLFVPMLRPLEGRGRTQAADGASGGDRPL